MVVLSYSEVPTALGRLTIAGGPSGICLVSFGSGPLPERPGYSFERRDTPLLEAATATILRYLSGESRDVTVPVDLSLARPFTQRVLKLLMDVPFGETTSYGALAKRAESSARAVGGAVGSNPIPVVIPCHRVIAADGSLGGFSGGLDRKRALLALEGHGSLTGGWAPRRRRVYA